MDRHRREFMKLIMKAKWFWAFIACIMLVFIMIILISVYAAYIRNLERENDKNEEEQKGAVIAELDDGRAEGDEEIL